MEMLGESVKNVIVLKGGMGKRQREAVVDQLKSIPDDEERVIVATGRHIGEGFDDARLDTLFLALPVSWRGTLQQYAGRLHRLHDNKHDVCIEKGWRDTGLSVIPPRVRLSFHRKVYYSPL